MADPFSILAAAAGLSDVCIRLTKFIKHANDDFQIVDRELGDLAKEIVSLQTVNALIERSFGEEHPAAVEIDQQQTLHAHRRAIEDTLTNCRGTVEQIEVLLKAVLSVGSGRYTKLDQLRKWLKHQAKEGEFVSLRKRLKAHQIALQLSLSAVNVAYSRSSQQSSQETYAELSQSIQGLESKMDSLGSIASVSKQNELVENAARTSYMNKHFFAPQTVSSNFVGREQELELLRNSLFESTSESSFEAQKRFVVYGLAGSGKTQFCSNKDRYWGIFWVNASSKEHAEQSFSTIAAIGKVAPNRAAAKSWLSSLGAKQRWLLIIDNADEKDFAVEQCIPDSNVGTVLVTTRNPMLKTHGNVGPRYLEFQGLEEKDSIELLLQSADDPIPWTTASISWARTIADTLGHLPLALIHAGKTILGQLCSLETYLDFFERSWARIRRIKDASTTTSISDANATIYSSYELILQSISAKQSQASEDALDLLKILAFLDRQHITLSIFSRAVLNPEIEVSDKKRKEKRRQKFNRSKPSPTWGRTLKDLAIRLAGFLSQLDHRSVLPKFLSEKSAAGGFDYIRLREALNELLRMSLISPTSGVEDCYSMHAAVHVWARQRPEMTLPEQAIWCQTTANILSQAILPPPLGDTAEDETFHRNLLPHVSHVQRIENKIRMGYVKNRASRQRLFPVLSPPVTAERLLQLVKFSLVYAQGGHYEEAEKIQLFVKNIATRYLGTEHMSTISITRLLSRTYWQLARIDEAVELQRQALDACTKLLGTESPETLQIMDQYGSCLWLQGHIPEARRVHTVVVEGLRRTLGDEDVETLKAMGSLGRAIGKDFDFTDSINMQTAAFNGLVGQLGPSHSATLEAMDNLAMAYFDRVAYHQGRPGDLARALELESKVFEIRKEQLGREHYHTLWSGLNLARIKAIRGEVEDAIAIFSAGHAVIRRDLGENHFIYLFGEHHHGRILMCANRYAEAEAIFLKVISSHKEDHGHHPDRLISMFSLIKCRNVLGRDEAETATIFEDLLERTKALFGPDHATVKYLLDGTVLSKDTRDVWDESSSIYHPE